MYLNLRIHYWTVTYYSRLLILYVLRAKNFLPMLRSCSLTFVKNRIYELEIFADYVESTTAKDNQTAAKADKSPILVGSPSSLQIHHSPFQSQTTPIYSEKSPFGENSNSSHPDHDTISSLPHTQTNSFPSYQYHGGSGHHPFYQRPDQLIRSPHPSYGPPGPGMNSQYPNYSRPPPNFVGPFPDSQSGYYNRHRYPGYEDGEQKNVEGKGTILCLVFVSFLFSVCFYFVFVFFLFSIFPPVCFLFHLLCFVDEIKV